MQLKTVYWQINYKAKVQPTTEENQGHSTKKKVVAAHGTLNEFLK